MDWKKLGKKLLFPPLWLMILLTLVSAAALILVFLQGWEETAVAYMVYVLAFYTLSVVVVYCWLVLPTKFRQIKQRIYDNPLGNRYMTDREFRRKVSLFISLGISLLYMAVNLLTWYWARSWWFVVLAVYYVIMALMWYLLLAYVRKHQIGASIQAEWKRARSCACILLLVNLSLSGAVLMILFQNRGYDYPGILIYVMAAYTFYSTVQAILDTVKNRKLESPVMAAASAISLSAALVSMLNLETAMFAQFGKELSATDRRIFIILTGAGISITVVTLSVLLIVKANQVIRKE